jgi:hypothetical protein
MLSLKYLARTIYFSYVPSLCFTLPLSSLFSFFCLSGVACEKAKFLYLYPFYVDTGVLFYLYVPVLSFVLVTRNRQRHSKCKIMLELHLHAATKKGLLLILRFYFLLILTKATNQQQQQ